MGRLSKTTVHFTLIAAISLFCAIYALAQQPAPPAKAAAAASPKPSGVTIQAIPELDETQSGTFLPDPDYVYRFSQADPSVRIIQARRAETDFTTFDPVAALNMEIQARKQSIDSLRLQLQNESFYKLHPAREPKRLREVPVAPERRIF